MGSLCGRVGRMTQSFSRDFKVSAPREACDEFIFPEWEGDINQHYKFVQEIGKGQTHGSVWSATRYRDEKYFAVKIMFKSKVNLCFG